MSLFLSNQTIENFLITSKFSRISLEIDQELTDVVWVVPEKVQEKTLHWARYDDQPAHVVYLPRVTVLHVSAKSTMGFVQGLPRYFFLLGNPLALYVHDKQSASPAKERILGSPNSLFSYKGDTFDYLLSLSEKDLKLNL